LVHVVVFIIVVVAGLVAVNAGSGCPVGVLAHGVGVTGHWVGEAGGDDVVISAS